MTASEGQRDSVASVRGALKHKRKGKCHEKAPPSLCLPFARTLENQHLHVARMTGNVALVMVSG